MEEVAAQNVHPRKTLEDQELGLQPEQMSLLFRKAPYMLMAQP